MGEGHTINDFGPFVAGVAAWMGSRDGRCGLSDLVTAASRPRWAAQLATWAATAIWAVAAYAVFVGVMFARLRPPGRRGHAAVVVGRRRRHGGDRVQRRGVRHRSLLAEPVRRGGSRVHRVPGPGAGYQIGFKHASGWALILPTNFNGNFDGNAQVDSGVFYSWLPDLPIARIMFLAGIALVALGLTGLPARAGSRRLRRAAAVVALVGVALAGTAAGLAGTAQTAAEGVVIPALHDAASDAPLTYTPVCGHAAGVQVCLNPAYGRWLPDVTAGLTPVLAEVTGLPARRCAPGSWTHCDSGFIGTRTPRRRATRSPADNLRQWAGNSTRREAKAVRAFLYDQTRRGYRFGVMGDLNHSPQARRKHQGA